MFPRKTGERIREIMPARPTIAHHRHPSDTVRLYHFKRRDSNQVKCFDHHGSRAANHEFLYECGAGLLQRPGTPALPGNCHGGEACDARSLIDPTRTWLEMHLLHKFNECYLYYSFYQDEQDPMSSPSGRCTCSRRLRSSTGGAAPHGMKINTGSRLWATERSQSCFTLGRYQRLRAQSAG